MCEVSLLLAQTQALTPQRYRRGKTASSSPAQASRPNRLETKPVLEVNAEHALVKKLEGSEHFNDLAHILFDQALLAEGGLPADPAAYVKRVNALLV